MGEKLVVHTLVNEVIDGAIRNVTLTVKNLENDVLSITMYIDIEKCQACSQKININTSFDLELIIKAFQYILCELHDRGIDSISIANAKGIDIEKRE